MIILSNIIKFIGAGNLNKRIKLLESTVIDDDTVLEPTKTWATKAEFWADAQHISDSEKYSAGMIQQKATIRFKFRRRAISHIMKIEYDNTIYTIVSIKPVYGNEAFLEVLAAKEK